MISTIYAYGNGEYLFYIFDGVARILKPENTQGIVKFVSLFGLLYIVGKNILEGRDARSFMTQFQWVLKYVFITGVLMVPVGSIVIKDVVSHIQRKVDNLPVGLTLPAGLIGTIGHSITVAFEKNFTPVNYLPYHQYGLVFGSQMVAETRNLKIEDPTFWENMYNFIDKCVIYDAMIGAKYTVNDIKTTDDIWKLISENASNFFSFDYRNQPTGGHRGPREIVSCKVGAERLSKRWNEVYNLSLRNLASGLLGITGKKTASDNNNGINIADNQALKTILTQNIQSSLNFLGANNTAQDYLKQHMMINAVQHRSSSFKEARGFSSYLSTLIEPGLIARQSLPVLKGVIEAIVYSSFIFVFFMLMLPGGWGIFLRYLGILYWLQLWAPLYAVVNMMMSLLSYQMTSGEFAGGINMANIASVSNTHQWIAAFSGYLSVSIPFIAKAIVDASGQGLVHLAGSVTSSMQSTAAAVANEAMSGNLSLDNTSVGNLQYANSNLLKSDYASSFRGSSSEWQMPTGAMERVQANGDFMTMTGQGLTASSGHTRINTNEMLGANWSKSLADTASETEALASDTSKLEQSHFAQSASMLAQYAERASKSDNLEFSESSQYANSTAKTIDFVKNLQENHGFTYQQASEAALNVSASLSGGVGVPKGALGGAMPVSGEVGASVGANGRFANLNMSSQELRQAEELAKRYNFNESYEDVVRGMTSEAFSKSMHIDNQLSHDFSENYQKMISNQQLLQNRIETGKHYSESLAQLKNGGVSYDHDGYHDMQQWLMERKGMSQYSAAKTIDSGGQEFKQYFNEYASEVAGTSKLISDAERIKSNLDIEKIQKGRQELGNMNVNTDVLTKVKQHAAERGMNTNLTHLESSEVQNKISELDQKANNSLLKTKTNTQLIELGMQREIDKQDNGRLINNLPKPLQWIAPGRPTKKSDEFEE